MGLSNRHLLSVCALSIVAACTPKTPPAPPPPPPPAKVVIIPPPIPPRPLPPGGAAVNFMMPSKDLNGVWKTPNQGLSRDEALWNFRSALNVASLSCKGFSWDLITTHYNKLLVTHNTRLATTYRAVDAEYKKRYPGKNALRVRDTSSTALYNYFALPAVRTQFCDLALVKVTEAIAVPSSALPEYGVGALADFDTLFLGFYDSYAGYQRDVAAWDMQYGPPVAVAAPAPLPSAATAPVAGSTPTPTTPK
jgi:hypothetical protein